VFTRGEWFGTAKSRYLVSVIATICSTWQEVFGAAGDVGYNDQDEEIINGTFRYHNGDDLPFVWKRVRQTTSSRRVRK